MVWSAVNVFEIPTCAKALGRSPASLAAFTLVTPEPLPLRVVATRPPLTLTLAPDCLINEFPIVVLLVQTGMSLVVPLPLTTCARASAPQPRPYHHHQTCQRRHRQAVVLSYMRCVHFNSSYSLSVLLHSWFFAPGSSQGS